MKVIFLDCNGVLNNSVSESRCGDYIGADSDKLRRLKKIVESTGAEIVLTSVWRLNTSLYEYLVKKLKRHGMRIIGQTKDFGQDGAYRGQEIMDWLEKNNDVVTSWVILDDRIFDDFEYRDIKDCLVKVDDGLQDNHIKLAVQIL